MISKKKFLEYQLDVERRFHAQDIEILKLKHEIEKNELRSQIKSPAPIVISEDEKKQAEEDAQKQKKAFAEWSEDPETLAKLGLGNSNV